MATCVDEPQLLFKRGVVQRRDELVFVAKLVLLGLMVTAGVWLALGDAWPTVVAGVVLLGASYAHAVELQHQCLHHSAFRRPRPHRAVGVVLGTPLLVSHTHYRVRHLQHHRFLGTPDDTEFFGFDTRQPLTLSALVRGAFDLGRLVDAARDIARCVRGDWTYDMGQISPKQHRAVLAEYRWFAAFLTTLAVVSLAGGGEEVLRLWLLPLIVAMPIHFLVELPEHILCDTSSVDVLRNTRSITGSWLTEWFTNGNNLHIEHHAAMNVPINQLRGRHAEVKQFGLHVQRTYAEFFALVAAEVWRNRGARS